jgi:hypothetical protein
MKFNVQVHYEASVYMDIEAEDQADAGRKALTKAYQNVPYDDLFAEVVFVEEKST